MVAKRPKPKLTYDDYAKTPEGERWELIDGELFMPPSPKEAHQSVQGNLGARMLLYARDNDLGRVYFAPFDVVLSEHDTVQPDILFVARERLAIVTEDNIQGAPDLVVEIRSPSTARQDWTVKRELYARRGVREYWLVDPEAATIAVLLLHDGKLGVAGIYDASDTLTSTVMDGFEIALVDVFQGRISPG